MLKTHRPRKVLNEKDEEIIRLICHKRQVPLELIALPCRKRDLVYTRQLIMYILKAETNLSLKAIGERFGQRDHTTVIHSVATIKGFIKINWQDVRQEVEILRGCVRAVA